MNSEINELTKIRKERRSIDIYTFAIIFLTSSFAVTNDIIPSLGVIAMWLVVLFGLFLKCRYVAIQNISVPILILFIYITLYIVRENDYLTGFKNLFTIICAMFYVAQYQFNDIKESFIRVMKLITIVSLVFFTLYLIIPSLDNMFVVQNRGGSMLYSCLGIFVKMVGKTRNCGLFWEPGAFQAFVNIALIFEISKDDCNIKNILWFAIGVATTFSTTGYMVLALLIIFYLFKHTDMTQKGLGQALVILLIVIFCAFVFQDYIFGVSQNTVFGKLYTFFEYEEYNFTRKSSATTRYFSIIKPLELFIQHPLLGVGNAEAKAQTDYFLGGNLTCTFVNWLAMYGIIYGGILICGYWKFCKRLFSETRYALLSLVCMIMITSSEDFSINAVFYIFPFIGYIKITQITENKNNIRRVRAINEQSTYIH